MHPNAILLLGPTGSGKSPLGDLLSAQGLAGETCYHFDFGEHLRTAAQSPDTYGLAVREQEYLHDVLASGALLEGETFYIAEQILAGCMHRLAIRDWLVLNGLPRHAGQADAVSQLVHVRLVLQLTCDVETVFLRLASNAGGDRTHRTDDQLKLVKHKLATYQQRTLPLVEWYQTRQVSVLELPVTDSSMPEDFLPLIEEELSLLD